MAPSERLLGDITLTNKVVLVTGGGSGISLAFCKLALEEGARVLIADLKLSQEAQDWLDANSTNVFFKKTDVSNWKDLNDLFPFAVEHLGDVPDVVIAGAGIFEAPSSNWWDDPEDERYSTLDINVGHVLKLARLAMRALVGRGKKGVICNIASSAGLQGFYSTPLYCATKFAVVGFTRSMAPAERLEGVKICAICPGPTDTPLWRQKTVISDIVPADALLRSDDIARDIINLVKSGKYGGGTVLQLSSGQEPRVATQWNNPPPAPSAKVFDGIMGGDSGEVHPLFKEARESMDNDRAEAESRRPSHQ